MQNSYNTSSIHGIVEQIPLMLCTQRGRSTLRKYIRKYIDMNERIVGIEHALDDICMAKLRDLAPDVYLVLFRTSMTGIELPLLLDIEEQYCQSISQSKSLPNAILENVVSEAISIDFFSVATTIHLRWTYHYRGDVMDDLAWGIPPPALYQQSVWYVSESLFRKRLLWMCPFILDLLHHESVQRDNIVLSGSSVPMCALNHVVYCDTQEAFLAMVDEVYWNRSVDLVVATDDDPNTLHARFLHALQVSAGQHSTWRHKHTLHWTEDTTGARNRRGATFYYTSDSCQYEIQLIVFTTVTESWVNPLEHAIAHQHLACVRAAFDGHKLFVTATCAVSWMTRFINTPLRFGDTVSQQRRSKAIFKYAMRGWGFSDSVLYGIRLPSILSEWLYAWGPRRMLPWYHPLYNRLTWTKTMPPARVRDLLECADDSSYVGTQK